MTSHLPIRRRPARWLAACGAAALASVIGVALLVQHGTAACAAPPGSAKQSGKATFYDLGGMGNCSFPGAPADDLFVALGDAEYADAAACGSYLDVSGPKGTVRVKVIDRCPECQPGHLDLSRTAFKRIADEVQGVVPITYRAVAGAPAPGGLTVRVKEGSSRWWLAVLIDNHVTPLASVKIKSRGAAWRAARHTIDNHWVIDSEIGDGPFSIESTDRSGNSATVTGIALRPGATQSTGVRLPGGAVDAASRGRAVAPVSKVTRSAAADSVGQWNDASGNSC